MLLVGNLLESGQLENQEVDGRIRFVSSLGYACRGDGFHGDQLTICLMLVLKLLILKPNICLGCVLMHLSEKKCIRGSFYCA
jgi:hypothetical protein